MALASGVVRAQSPAAGGSAPAALVLAPDTGRLAADKRYMPSAISEPLMSMTIQVVKETPKESVYRSRHFEFTTPVKLGAGAMKEVCRSFESTYELVSKLPWGINPWPEDNRIFRAQLFLTRGDYLATGAPEWSAAVYSNKDRVFRIPFEEIGIKTRNGNEYYLGGVINNDTITHEVTHQMMHEYLRFMPIWMIEGLAEYTAHLPYQSGRYNVAGAVEGYKQMRKDYGKSKRRGVVLHSASPPPWIGAGSVWNYTTSITTPRPIASLAPDPPQQRESSTIRSTDRYGEIDLPSVYHSSHALVFYFMHFDGDGKATRLKKYFDAIHEERKLWVSFNATLAAYETAAKKYLEDWEAFKKLPGVENLGGGLLRYPSNRKAPSAPVLPVGPGNIDPTKVCAKHLGILLDGRSLEALDQEVHAAFQKFDTPL